MSKPTKLYAFEWIGGGYNTVLAKTTKEALKKATEFGINPGTVRLFPDPKTLTDDAEKIRQIEYRWAGSCD